MSEITLIYYYHTIIERVRFYHPYDMTCNDILKLWELMKLECCDYLLYVINLLAINVNIFYIRNTFASMGQGKEGYSSNIREAFLLIFHLLSFVFIKIFKMSLGMKLLFLIG